MRNGWCGDRGSCYNLFNSPISGDLSCGWQRGFITIDLNNSSVSREQAGLQLYNGWLHCPVSWCDDGREKQWPRQPGWIFDQDCQLKMKTRDKWSPFCQAKLVVQPALVTHMGLLSITIAWWPGWDQIQDINPPRSDDISRSPHRLLVTK